MLQMEEIESDQILGKIFLNEVENNGSIKLDSNLAVLCCIELMTNLITKFSSTINKLYNWGVRINFFVVEDIFQYGYVGSDFSKINPMIYSKNIKYFRNYLVSNL